MRHHHEDDRERRCQPSDERIIPTPRDQLLRNLDDPSTPNRLAAEFSPQDWQEIWLDAWMFSGTRLSSAHLRSRWLQGLLAIGLLLLGALVMGISSLVVACACLARWIGVLLWRLASGRIF